MTLKKENLVRQSNETRALFFRESLGQNTKARIRLDCLDPRDFDSVGQGSENEVRVKENMFDYCGVCFSCLYEKQRYCLAGMWNKFSSFFNSES